MTKSKLNKKQHFTDGKVLERRKVNMKENPIPISY